MRTTDLSNYIVRVISSLSPPFKPQAQGTDIILQCENANLLMFSHRKHLEFGKDDGLGLNDLSRENFRGFEVKRGLSAKKLS